MKPPQELWTGDPTELATVVADVIRQLPQDPEPERFHWLIWVAENAMDVGYGPLASQILTACRTLLPLLGDGEATSRVLVDLDNTAGLLALHEGRIADAERLLLAAAATSRQIGDLLGEALAHQNLSAALLQSEGTDSARHEALLALEIYERIDDRLRRCQVLINLANYDLDEGRIDEAEALLDEAEPLASGALGKSMRTSILGTRAGIARARGDLELAGSIYRKVLARVRRGDSIGRTRLAMQNVGSWYAETKQPRRAVLWLGRAAGLASREGDSVLAAGLFRAQAVQLLQAGTVDLAASTMRLAIAMSQESADLAGVAQGRADLAAILIDTVVGPPARKDREALEVLHEADSLLRSALEYFRSTGDTTWAERVISNSVSLSILRGDPLQALERLGLARESLESSDAQARLSLDRQAVSIAISEAHRPDLAIGFLRDAATLVASGAAASAEMVPGRTTTGGLRGNTAAAWELALGASQFREFQFALPEAVALFLEARDLASEDDALRFHITNDLGGTYEQLGERGAAIASFEACLELATSLDDRVMRQQVLANRAEMARRNGEAGAVERLDEAAHLAAELGDTVAEAEALCNLAWAYLDSRALEEAEATVSRVVALAESPGLDAATNSTADSIRGGIAFARGEFDAAQGFYLRAAEVSRDARRIDSLLAAALALAKDTRRDRYRRLLRRLIREGQATHLDGSVAEGLLPCAEEWLTQGDVGLSAQTYATTILLALNQSIGDMPVIPEIGRVPGPSAVEDEAVTAHRLSPVIDVIVRMTHALAGAPAIRSRMMRDLLSRLRKELPEPIDEFVTSLIDQSAAIMSEADGE